MRFFRTFSDFLFPARCPCCDREIDQPGEELCRRCGPELRRARLNSHGRCTVCFLPVHPITEECSFCRSRSVFFDGHRSLYRLSAGWRRVLHRWKFENERRLAGCFTREIGDLASVGTRFGIEALDRVGYIDSGRSGRDRRSYAPCADLCAALSRDNGPVAYRPDLQKTGRGKQSARGFEDRFFAVHGGLRLNGLPPAELHAQRYLLVEDVFTTGATANEAARVLKKNGASEVYVLSMLLTDETVSTL